MRLTKKLLALLHRVFNKDPQPFLALRIACDGSGLSWSVADAVLTTAPAGGTAGALSIDLGACSIAGLAAFLAAQPGYAVPYCDTSSLSQLSARVLLDGTGVSQANGASLFGYTSVLWAYLDANAAELREAGTQIRNLPRQMNTVSAAGSWLDFLGAYYGVARQPGEQDAQYGPRIVATVIRPLGNNMAIAAALQVVNGGLPVAVDDYDVPVNGSYGLFDVTFTVSLAMLEATAYTLLVASIFSLVDGMRDAGTFLRELDIVAPIEAAPHAGAAVISGATVWIHPVRS